MVWGKPGTQSQHKNSGIQTVTARDRQRSRESRISGARRGQSKSTIKEVAFISGRFGIFSFYARKRLRRLSG